MRMISWSCIKLNNIVRLSGITEEGRSFVSTEITGAKMCKGNKLRVKTDFDEYEINLNSSQCNNTIIDCYEDASNYEEAKLFCKYAIYNAAVNSLDRGSKEAIHNAFKIIKSEYISSEREFTKYAQSRLDAKSTEFDKYKLANNHFCITLVEGQETPKIAEIVRCINHSREKSRLYKTVNPIKYNYDGAGNMEVTITNGISFSINNGVLNCRSSQLTFVNKTGMDLQTAQKTKIFNA